MTVTKQMVDLWWNGNCKGPDPRGKAPITYNYYYNYEYQRWVKYCPRGTDPDCNVYQFPVPGPPGTAPGPNAKRGLTYPPGPNAKRGLTYPPGTAPGPNAKCYVIHL